MEKVAQPVGIEPTQSVLEANSPILGTLDCVRKVSLT